MRNPVGRMARSLRCTEGQAYTLLIGLVIATLLAVGGVPAVLRTHPASPTAHPTTTTPATQPGAHP
ncbi:MAG: hypothetical protein ACYDH6_11150 [Acidimicrobiales bacterium]